MPDDNFGEINTLISSVDTANQRLDSTDRRVAQIDQTLDRAVGMQQFVAERVMTHDTMIDSLEDADKTIKQAVRDVQTQCEMSTAELYGRVGELRGTVDDIQRGDMYADSDLVLGRAVGNRVQFGIDQTRQGLGYLYYSSGSIHYCRVYAGSLRVPGVGNYAVSQTDVTLSAANAGDAYWIYVTCTWSSPSATATGDVTEPTSTGAVLNFPLYKFVKNTDGSYYMSRILHWGDAIIQRPIIPDTNVTGTTDYSLNFNTLGGLQIYGFETATSDVPSDPDMVMLWHSGTPIDVVMYANAANFSTWLCNNASDTIWANAAWLAQVGTWVITSHTHAQHTSFASDNHLYATGYGYLCQNDIGTPAQCATRNKCDADMRIGDASGVASINPAGRLAYQENGTTTILDWNSTTAGIYLNATAWFKNNSGTPLFQIDADNTWATAALAAKVSGAITLDASTGGALTFKAKNDSTWTLSDKLYIDMGDTIYIRPTIASNSNAVFGSSLLPFGSVDVYSSINTVLGGAGTASLYLGAAASQFAHIYWNGDEYAPRIIQVPDGQGGLTDLTLLAKV